MNWQFWLITGCLALETTYTVWLLIRHNKVCYELF